jgi:hypothetical protein
MPDERSRHLFVVRGDVGCQPGASLKKAAVLVDR